MPRRWATALFKTPIVVIAAVGFIAFSPGNAVAAPVSCGDTITADTTLHADLTGCPGAGLVIGADGITLDLNGHTITGNLHGAVGIDNSAGHDGVTIKNGAVRNFTNGVLLLKHATGNRVQRLTLVADNSNFEADNGILISDSDHNQIEHNSISGSGNGIFLSNTTDSTVDRNRVSSVNVGIFLIDADRNVVDRNAISDLLDTGVEIVGGSENVLERNTIVRTQNGAAVLGGSENVLERNTIVSAQSGALVLASFTDEDTGVTRYATGNVVTGNTMAAHLFGIVLAEANANQVTRNSVTDAGTVGDPNDPLSGLGLVIDGGSGNLLARNAVTRGRGVGIQIGVELASPIPPSDNTIVRNETTRNASDGIRILDMAQNTTVNGNLANGNAADGIHVLSRATTLTRNLAVRNGNLGIEAVPGVTDGGGNHAFANGNPAQCINVAC